MHLSLYPLPSIAASRHPPPAVGTAGFSSGLPLSPPLLAPPIPCRCATASLLCRRPRSPSSCSRWMRSTPSRTISRWTSQSEDWTFSRTSSWYAWGPTDGTYEGKERTHKGAALRLCSLGLLGSGQPLLGRRHCADVCLPGVVTSSPYSPDSFPARPRRSSTPAAASCTRLVAGANSRS